MMRTLPERGQFHFEFFNEYDVLQHSLYPARRQEHRQLQAQLRSHERIEFNFDIPLLTIYNSESPRLGESDGDGDA